MKFCHLFEKIKWNYKDASEHSRQTWLSSKSKINIKGFYKSIQIVRTLKDAIKGTKTLSINVGVGFANQYFKVTLIV